MTLSYDQEFCTAGGDLYCLSSAPEQMLPPLCSAEDPCLHFFDGMGFRPAAWAMQRDQYGDHAILIVSGDDAYLAKYDLPADSMAFLPVSSGLPFLPEAGVATQTALATPGGSPWGGSFGGTPSFGFPGFSGGSSNSDGGTDTTTEPGTDIVVIKPDVPIDRDRVDPSTVIPGPGGETEIPNLPAVPLSGSGMFMLMALVAMMATAGHRAMARA
ncbi:hypothetical protein Q4511_13560 [Paracoccus sp. 1_MG-2023]|uniref:hypothetical protein n=1 Tax=unclassified Paracoccus (in: a-proteobacteria) TaxID=2688777 RepID=UPI001C089299|nr:MULTISPECIES: hypothetical protein [unclassified Paracoccus (in: a-proteobacteria)]MBU2958955.1 hypothetical protein [Paracoccus sp. C2R09]MDO6669954.1 hypothetical protein [Paracoccus sp. 1_MG-2023]